MKFIYSIFFLLLSNIIFSQPTRREIIENKIRSISATFYGETVGGQREYSRKTYYSVKGDDSLEYTGNILAYTYTPEISNGKIKMLTRKTADGETDEMHLYEYRPDGSYTIEIIAQGAGTISLKEFNRQNDCLSEILSGTDTVVYSYNFLGKVKEIKMKGDGVWEIIATTKFDDKGLPIETTGTEEPLNIIRYKNNMLGLPEEVKQYQKNDAKEVLMGKFVIVYEFWQ